MAESKATSQFGMARALLCEAGEGLGVPTPALPRGDRSGDAPRCEHEGEPRGDRGGEPVRTGPEPPPGEAARDGEAPRTGETPLLGEATGAAARSAASKCD
mmetsp:Transcript_145177/g.256438  ORF Transcript_145177/g.256438 Transcript_145177/m.256438 type:complete len:101 (+) Transcript_145177:1394-1696(+)